MTAPIWITPSGFVGTFTEQTYTTASVHASGTDTVYSLISGELPTGITFSSDGIVSGIAYIIPTTITSNFVVRATNPESGQCTDRTFFIISTGPLPPEWVTPAGFLTLGPDYEQYVINKKSVNYQLEALQDVMLPSRNLVYYIKDKNGQLPPGLTLTTEGLIYGRVEDHLSLDSTINANSGYDTEKYDRYPYDHRTIISNDNSGSTLNYVSKIYQFTVTVSDGYVESNRTFKIQVDDPAAYRIYSPSYHYTGTMSYIVGPEWITDSNLGSVRSNNREVIKLETYDPYPYLGPVSFTCTNLPPNWFLTTNTGILHALMPYQPMYDKEYTFAVDIIKEDYTTITPVSTTVSKSFTISILGENTNEMSWLTPSILPQLKAGETSELSVAATVTNYTGSISYTLMTELPYGLSLNYDGTIVGRTAWDIHTYIDGLSGFMLDSGLTTIDVNPTFTVKATTDYGQSIIGDFTIPLVADNIIEHTRMWMKPYWSRTQRSIYKDFTSDPNIFPQQFLYRPLDINFGVQYEPRVYIEYGIEKTELDNYAVSLSNFSGKISMWTGDVKIAKAKDSAGNDLYEVIYVELIDSLNNPPPTVDVIVKTVHPGTISNYRSSIESIEIDGTPIMVDNYLLPKFMKTDQTGEGIPLGYVPILILCFALPNRGNKIVKNIKDSGFVFNQFYIELDRIVVEEIGNTTDSGYIMINN